MAPSIVGIAYIHFYVHDIEHWFKKSFQPLGFQAVSQEPTQWKLRQGKIEFWLSQPRTIEDSIATYLKHHSPGIAEIGFHVHSICAWVDELTERNAFILEPIQLRVCQEQQYLYASIQAQGNVAFGFVEGLLPSPEADPSQEFLHEIDHVVFNVPTGELQTTVEWYERVLQFKRGSYFEISTDLTALKSQVMMGPNDIKIPINEPIGSTSQIQEFLDHNQGPGVQHISLHTPNIMSTVEHFRSKGIEFLKIPDSYYEALSHLSAQEQNLLKSHQVLLDGDREQYLLQIFTEPIFEEPTVFLELIQREGFKQGFGQGNFQALFEAMEKEQIKRGTLTAP
ncbi:MAG: 4-hydroxyphenylpyruvate dioxygenase [Gloeobacterales cyanobacterium]